MKSSSNWIPPLDRPWNFLSFKAYQRRSPFLICKTKRWCHVLHDVDLINCKIRDLIAEQNGKKWNKRTKKQMIRIPVRGFQPDFLAFLYFVLSAEFAQWATIILSSGSMFNCLFQEKDSEHNEYLEHRDCNFAEELRLLVSVFVIDANFKYRMDVFHIAAGNKTQVMKLKRSDVLILLPLECLMRWHLEQRS